MDKKFGIKHVVAIGIGTALFVVLSRTQLCRPAQRYLHFSPLFLVPLLAVPSV